MAAARFVKDQDGEKMVDRCLHVVLNAISPKDRDEGNLNLLAIST